MLLGGALMSTIGAKLIRNNMRVVAFGIALVGVSVVGLGVVHNLLAYLLIDVVNGLASAICMGPMRTIIQTEADEKMVGRVFGLDTTLSTLGMPLGMLIFAPLADVIPISLVFIIGGPYGFSPSVYQAQSQLPDLRIQIVRCILRQIVNGDREWCGSAIARPIHECDISIDDCVLCVTQY